MKYVPIINRWQTDKFGSSNIIQIALKGGEGSGNFGHKGRPGKRGGSSPRTSGLVDKFDKFDQKDETFFSDWVRSIGYSYDEGRAFAAYGDGHYREINSLLRSGEYQAGGNGETDFQIDRMLEAMYRTPAPENFVVYRGTNLSIDLDDPDPQRSQLLELLDSKVEDPDVEVLFSDRGFLSTSVDQYTARSFYSTGSVETNNTNNIGGVPIKVIHSLNIEIHVPKGMPAAPLYNPEHPDELEVLLPPGQRFRVSSIRRRRLPPSLPETPVYHYDLVLEVAP